MSKTHGGKIVDVPCLCNLQEDLLETKYNSSFLYGDPPGQCRKGSTVESCWRYQGDTFSGVLYLHSDPYLLYVTLNSPEIIFRDMT